jgi:hypothetical protein
MKNWKTLGSRIMILVIGIFVLSVVLPELPRRPVLTSLAAAVVVLGVCLTWLPLERVRLRNFLAAITLMLLSVGLFLLLRI